MSHKETAGTPARSLPNNKPSLAKSSSTTNGTEYPIDPDAPREGRLASLKNRGPPSNRGTAPKIVFKPKVVQRRKKDTESLLNPATDDGEQGSSTSRRGDRGRGRGSGRGRIRVEAPLIASGPFAQGPANAATAKGKSVQRSGGPTSSSKVNGTADFNVLRKMKDDDVKKPSSGLFVSDYTEEEANLDDAGRPMKNLNRMRDSANHWAPITTERKERTVFSAPVAVPHSQSKVPNKSNGEPDEIAFVDVKTEPTESSIASRAPSQDPSINKVEAADEDEEMPSVEVDVGDDGDDEDISLPGVSLQETVKETKKKLAPKAEEPTRMISLAEAEEDDRMSADLNLLRMALASSDDERSTDEDQLYFIQLPEVLPFWKPGPDDDNDDVFIKEEEPKTEVVEIDQKAEDEKAHDGTTTTKVSFTVDTDKNVKATQAPAGSATGPAAVSATTSSGTKAESDEVPKRRRKKQRPLQFPPPEGLLGQLHVHRSGKISCTWAGIKMDVGRGSDCGFLQDVVAIDTKHERKAWVLGRVTNRMMLVPDLVDLLDTADTD